jgi:hypothetical protein
MVYNSDNQQRDEDSLTIGKAVCEIFCPYFEQEAIEIGLAQVLD